MKLKDRFEYLRNLNIERQRMLKGRKKGHRD